MKKIFEKLLYLSMVSLWAINSLSGIVGGIWLLVTGWFNVVILGILFGILMPWVYTVVISPTFLLLPLLLKALEKGKRTIVSIMALVLAGYNNFILSIWVISVFVWLLSFYELPLIALLLWGYAVIIGPVGYMASKEGPDAGTGTTLGVLFTQIAYLILAINILLGNSVLDGSIWLLLLILVFTLPTSLLGFLPILNKKSKTNILPKTEKHGRGKILLVDDDTVLLKMYRNKLTINGFVVDYAFNGEAGLEKIRNNPYDIIITDIMMPKMNGLDMIKEVKKLNIQNGHFIVVSNLTTKEEIDRALALGVKEYLITADITPDDLVNAVNKYIRK